MPKSRRPANYGKRAKKASSGFFQNKQVIAIAAVALVVVVAIIVIVITQNQKTAGTGSSTPLASGGPTPALVGTKQYASAPPMLIDVGPQHHRSQRPHQKTRSKRHQRQHQRGKIIPTGKERA